MTIEQYYAAHAADGGSVDLVEFPGDENERLCLERTEAGAYEVNDYFGSYQVPASVDADEVRDVWLGFALMHDHEYSVDRGCNPWIVTRLDALDGGSFEEHRPNERKAR